MEYRCESLRISFVAKRDWLSVKLSVEENLRYELYAHAIMASNDHKAVAELCALTVKQLAYKDRLLKQATQRIAELEFNEFLGLNAN